MIQPRDYEGGNQSCSDVTSQTTSYRSQTTKMVEAGPGNSGHMRFHCEMRIEVDSEIPDHLDWLDDIGADSKT